MVTVYTPIAWNVWGKKCSWICVFWHFVVKLSCLSQNTSYEHVYSDSGGVAMNIAVKFYPQKFPPWTIFAIQNQREGWTTNTHQQEGWTTNTHQEGDWTNTYQEGDWTNTTRKKAKLLTHQQGGWISGSVNKYIKCHKLD